MAPPFSYCAIVADPTAVRGRSKILRRRARRACRVEHDAVDHPGAGASPAIGCHRLRLALECAEEDRTAVDVDSRLPAILPAQITGAYRIGGSRFVSLLLGARCPAAIAWFIAARVVEPIDRMARGRARTEVGEERHEVVTPARAHADAAPAIGWESRVAWVAATTHHSVPDVVFPTRKTAPRAIPKSLYHWIGSITLGQCTFAAVSSQYHNVIPRITDIICLARRIWHPAADPARNSAIGRSRKIPKRAAQGRSGERRPSFAPIPTP
jgi:hypothetical protein